jgi:trehalose/maltose hydrolase-like predicted phosphorylase
MSGAPQPVTPGQGWPDALSRRFEAAVVDWSILAGSGGATSRCAEAPGLCALIEDLCVVGFELAIVADLDVDTLDGQLGARPRGPGRLLLYTDGGSRVFEAHADGLAPRHDSASARALLVDLWLKGIHPSQVLAAGVDLLPLADYTGGQAVIVDGGPAFLRDVLHDQRRRWVDGELPADTQSEDWSLIVDGYDAQLERVHESLLTIGDGRLGTRGSPLAGDGATTPAVFMAGVYEGSGPATELASLPVWSRVLDEPEVGPSQRRLDLRSGVLYEDGPVRSLRFSSFARPGTVAVRVHGDASRLPPTGARTKRGAATLSCQDLRRDRRFERLGAYDREASVAEAAAMAAREIGFEGLLREHREAWARRWHVADIAIDGDPQLQRAVRFALFHLMAAVGDRGEAAVGARGLSGPAYRGHVFWDSDVFVLPFLAATHPAAARAMLEYRARRLDAARAAAQRLGRAGARFPWESAADGADVTPASARMPTGEVVPVRTGECEEHVVADVAWSAACYLDWTGDVTFAAGAGRDLLVETARYWASRVCHDRDTRAHIESVIGPDEYHELVDDNAFTNVMARWNLRRAASVDGISGDERAGWLAIADALVDGYDPNTRLYEQYTGFFDLESIVIAEVSPRRPIAADLLLGRERTGQAQVIKQADVLMLHHLLPDEVAPDSLRPNLEFYEPRTAHGSSLSPAIHAGLLARDRRYDAAVEWLNVAARMDLDDLTGSTAGGLHLATMGGLWQALVFGFAGVRARREHLLVDPRLPPHWRSLSVGLRYRGEPLRLQVGHEFVEIESEALRLERVDEHWEVTPR